MTTSLEKKIDEIIMDCVILGVDSGQAYFEDTDQATEKLLQLLTETIEAVVPSRLLSIKDGKSEHYAKGYNAAIDKMTTKIANELEEVI